MTPKRIKYKGQIYEAIVDEDWRYPSAKEQRYVYANQLESDKFANKIFNVNSSKLGKQSFKGKDLIDYVQSDDDVIIYTRDPDNESFEIKDIISFDDFKTNYPRAYRNSAQLF